MRRFIFFAVVIAPVAVSLGLRASPSRASASHEVQVEARQFGFDPALIQVPRPAGRYEIACSEFCGSGHGQMKAALVSVAATQASH